MTRPIPGRVESALDLIWRRCLDQLGWALRRDPDVYASWDGQGTLSVCPEADYDPDDSLAQLVLHEICHALVQGPARQRQVDWGLVNTDDETSALAEHACHRLQAALTDRHGLRPLLAVTTDWRPYWDALPADPLAPGEDPAIPLAREAWPEALRGPWSAPLDEALRATADLADVLRPIAPPTSLWARTQPRHPVTRVALRGDHQRCDACAWRDAAGTCLASPETPTVAADDPACLGFEASLTPSDCARCGACCRHGFHAVGFGEEEVLAKHPPEGAVRDADAGWLLPRPAGRCVLLSSHAPWRCTRYGERPQACRDFEINGPHCLTARRRIGVSRL